MELGPSDMEYAIIKLFMIDLYHLVDLKAAFAKNFHIQPSEVDRMVFWEYEMFVESLNALVKEDNERQEDEMKKYNVNGTMKSIKNGSFTKGMNTSKFAPRMPDFGSMKVPSFKY
jgi:hypothetical protein